MILYIFQTSRSLTTTVVRDTSVVLELPRNNATRIIMNTAVPTTHTHGCAYHVVVVVVVLVVVSLWPEPELSWAQVATCIRLKKNSSNHLQAMPPLSFFISLILKQKIS